MSEIIEFPNQQNKPLDVRQLVGKTLMLNVSMSPKFQCGGFSVTSGKLIDVVTEQTITWGTIKAIANALESGILIDVSSNEIVTKGFNLKNSSSSRITEEDTDKKVFMGRDSQGRMFVVAPKDDEEREKFEQQIKDKGTIDFSPSSDEFTGISQIIKEELL